MGAPPVEWNDWVSQFTLMEFKESLSSALAGCQDVAAIYPSLAQTLFTAAFVSCWRELRPEQQQTLAEGVERVMRNHTGVKRIMLGVAEAMTHHHPGTPIPRATLGDIGMECHAYAGAAVP